MNPLQLDETIKKHSQDILRGAAEMARVFDGYSVTPHYDWVAVREGIAKMLEDMAESFK